MVGGEYIEHAVERTRRIAGVKSAENQVTGFGGGERELDRLEVTHFTDHDHIGVFP